MVSIPLNVDRLRYAVFALSGLLEYSVLFLPN